MQKIFLKISWVLFCLFPIISLYFAAEALRIIQFLPIRFGNLLSGENSNIPSWKLFLLGLQYLSIFSLPIIIIQIAILSTLYNKTKFFRLSFLVTIFPIIYFILIFLLQFLIRNNANLFQNIKWFLELISFLMLEIWWIFSFRFFWQKWFKTPKLS